MRCCGAGKKLRTGLVRGWQTGVKWQRMSASQRILKERRHYNKWVADQTLEDYALRFTAVQGRRMSIARVGMTALGASAFLALESLAAAVTLTYGFTNAVWAMVSVCLVLFITGFPIAYYCAKHGLDIDLLTRGAGFGYLGSTLTSLIYATFTFIFFAIEAAILAGALYALLGIPLFLGYLLCALAVIPIVTHGIKAISRFQVGTQWAWLVLQVAALLVVVTFEYDALSQWQAYAVPDLPQSQGFDWVLFGSACSVLFALMAQIGEQADYLRFMPPKTVHNRWQWWGWLTLSGPGWVWVGLIKMLLGSFVAYLMVRAALPFEQATDPTYIYQYVFALLTESPALALVLAAIMVMLCQMKINVTNAYAGSIAWSNFFSRLTHSHPGRVVWLVFNVTIALILMELGIYQALESILGSFAILAVSWLGALSADLMINKPLGLSPAGIEFKRAHLYDINPVGTGSMLISSLLGFAAFMGLFGEIAQHLCHFIALGCAFVCAPTIAYITRGKFYLARKPTELQAFVTSQPVHPQGLAEMVCGVCENHFEPDDMSYCPAYQVPICSLCCSLDVRCLDSCKPKLGLAHRLLRFAYRVFPVAWVRGLYSRFGRFLALVLSINVALAGLLLVIHSQLPIASSSDAALIQNTFIAVFLTLSIVSWVVCWLFLLAHESRITAQKESNLQSIKLTREIDAHEQTDRALQAAKEYAERANAAKSRYLTGISHELRTPLQSILGYAQLLGDKENIAQEHKRGLAIIHRSGQYLADLIEGLLDISKIEAGRLDIYRNQVKLPELIDQLAQMFSLQAENKALNLYCRIHNPLPETVVADEKRLRQILINLLSNAVKYTPQGRVDFDVYYRNQVAEFRIKDTGPGIAPAQLQRIFEPFERIRNSDTAHLPGTGLGLTIVKLLTEIMGGDLQVNSAPGQGTEFKVSLMLPWVDSAQLSDDASQSTLIGYAGYPRTLCIVDDDPVLRGLLADLLVPLGFKVLEAHDGPTCLELVKQQWPDLFLLDIAMPGMSGLELAKALRHAGGQVPIVMLSADAREYNQPSDYQTDYNDYLVKPVSNRVLLETLAKQLSLEWITQRSAAEPLPAPARAPRSEDTPLPDHPLLRELSAYAEMGYQKGVKQLLAQIAQAQLLHPTQLTRLEQLSASFQFEALATFLKEHNT